MPTPEAKAQRQSQADWVIYVNRELHRMRIQFTFLLVFLLAGLVLLAVRSELAANAIRQDRYNACVQRVADLTDYNGQLSAIGQPPQPLPVCPPNPKG